MVVAHLDPQMQEIKFMKKLFLKTIRSQCHLVLCLTLVLGVFSGCERQHDGWVVSTNGHVSDSCYYENDTLNGDCFRINSFTGQRIKESYSHGILNGYQYIKDVANDESIRRYYKNGFLMGNSHLKNNSGNLKKFIFYYKNDVLNECSYDINSGRIIDFKGNSYIEISLREESLHQGDTLILNANLINVPHTKTSVCWEHSEVGDSIVLNCYDRIEKFSPFVFVEKINEIGDFKKNFFFSVLDTISKKIVSEYRYEANYRVLSEVSKEVNSDLVTEGL